MTEFLFDVTLTATVQVEAGDQDSAVRYLREHLNGYEPNIVLPKTSEDPVTSAGIVTEISIGNNQNADIQLVSENGDVAAGKDMPNQSQDRLVELLHKYGEAKFGDEWWPGNAGAYLSDEEAEELESLL